jgi:hypothetical protein
VGILPAQMNRQDACSTSNKCSCGVGILPAPKRLISRPFKP